MSECRQTVVESPPQASPAPGVQVPSSTASEVVSQLATESSLEGDIFCGAVKVGLINPDSDPESELLRFHQSSFLQRGSEEEKEEEE